MISGYFQDKAFTIKVIQVSVPTPDAEDDEIDQFDDLLELTPKKKKKRCPFHFRGLERKSRKSKCLVSQANLALEYKIKKGKG